MNKIRRLYIKAIATPEFKKYYGKNWQRIIQKTINKTSMVLKKEFGISVVLKAIQIKKCVLKSFVYCYFWDYLYAFKKELLSTGCDVIIIFTDAPFFYAEDTDCALAVAGYCDHDASRNVSRYRDYIILTNPEKTKMHYENYKTVDWEFLKNLLLHEIGHLFGADHVENKKSFMCACINPKSCLFNTANKKRIIKNKWKKFP